MITLCLFLLLDLPDIYKLNCVSTVLCFRLMKKCIEGAIINLKTVFLFDMYQVLIQEIVPNEHSWGAIKSAVVLFVIFTFF